LERHFERADTSQGVAAIAAAFAPARRNAFATVGVAQAKHTETRDGDATVEAQVNDLRDAPGLPASGHRGLAIPGRAWIAVGTAALLWAAIAAVVILVF
jgi:hypothetical protein